MRQGHMISMLEHWEVLDRTLVQLRESHAVRITITYDSPVRKEEACEFVRKLVPETMERGIVKLADFDNRY
jgi:hypothetical protein